MPISHKSVPITETPYPLLYLASYNAGDPGSPWWGRSPGEGNGNPLQYSCLENPMDRGVWQATVHGVSELDKTERLHFLCYPASTESNYS